MMAKTKKGYAYIRKANPSKEKYITIDAAKIPVNRSIFRRCIGKIVRKLARNNKSNLINYRIYNKLIDRQLKQYAQKTGAKYAFKTEGTISKKDAEFLPGMEVEAKKIEDLLLRYGTTQEKIDQINAALDKMTIREIEKECRNYDFEAALKNQNQAS